MLALERPLGVVAGLSLFGDHADPSRVFYAPTRPKLALTDGRAELALVKFRNRDAATGGVGLLSFTTELAASDTQLDEAVRHLQRQGIPEPVLVQVPWTSGRAVFAAALRQGDGFVESMLGEVTPDLAATNRAVFSMLLTDEGARLVEGMIAGDGPSPLGVRYELKYDGLRPALDARIRADYKRVYDELSWGFQIGVAYEGIGVRAAVESATQKLVERGAIEIEVLHFTDSADLQARVDTAIRWLQDRILTDFFKSTLQPPAHENLLQRAIDAALRMGTTLAQAVTNDSIARRIAEELGIPPDLLGRLAGLAENAGGTAAGGSTGAGAESTFALKLQFTFRDISQEELKTIEIDWREARAEERTAAPQALLAHFGVTPTVVEVEDAGAYWETLRVRVRPLGDFATLGVLRMIAHVAYPDEQAPTAQQALVFEAGQDQPRLFSAWTNGRGPRYRVRHEVHFDENGAWPGPPIFVSPWRTEQSEELAIHPLSNVPRLEIEIAPGSVNFTDTPHVQVDLRVDGAHAATHMLDAGARSATFRRRFDAAAGAPLRPPVDARLTWFLAEGRRVESEWLPVEGASLLVHAPWRSTRTVRLLPLLPDDILDAIVTLTLLDGARRASVEEHIEPGSRKMKQVSLPALSADAPPVEVSTLVIRGDGSSFVGQAYTTTDPVVVVRDREGTFRQVPVRFLAGASIAAQGVMAVQVELLDAAGQVVDSIVFTESQRGPGTLLAPAEAGAAPARVRITRYALDGTATVAALADLTTPELLVPAVVR